jgi:RNA polymerase sigma factor (TIGR02999 family)
MTDVTQILHRIESGKPNASEQLLTLLYEELRRLAAAQLAKERPGQTLQATALVHEAYLRLVGAKDASPWDSRGHFFAAAAEAMRRILVENARRKGRLRHGGDMSRVEIDAEHLGVAMPLSEDLLSIHDALDDLEAVDSQAAQVVKLRYFLGLSFEETADLLKISERTAYRDWAYARAWLYSRLTEKKP